MELKEGIIICDTTTKKEILAEMKGVLNYTFYSIADLKAKLFGTLKKKTVFALMEKYSITYEMAIECMKYIPYVEEKIYNSAKLDSLVTMRKFVMEENLLEKDKFFFTKLKNTNVTFVNPKMDQMLENIISELKKYTHVEILETESASYHPLVKVYKDNYEEALACMTEIHRLHEKGVSYNNITILNSSEYIYDLARLSKNFSIPVDLPISKNINSLPDARKFLASLDEVNTFEEALTKINSNSIVYEKALSVINDYELQSKCPKEYHDFFYKQFKATGYEMVLYEEMVNTDASAFSDSDYVFYLGLNLGSVPKVYKDDEYLSDSELESIGLNSSVIKNQLSLEELKEILTTTKNIYLSYKENNKDGKCEPSNIIKALSLETKKQNVEYGYSKTDDNIRFGSKYTNYIKYRVLDEDLKNYDWSKISYGSYDNKYKRINKEYILNMYEEKAPKYSYSSLKTYFACPFAYYADRILGLDTFEKTVATKLGTYSHAVLEDSYATDFDFSESVKKNTIANAEDAKDRFYFKQMEAVLEELIRFNKEHEEKSSLTEVHREQEIEVMFEGYSFVGFIDKLMYAEIDGEIYAAIMDYKTGSDIVSLDNVEYGFHLQLPSYMFLLQHYDPFKGKKIHILGIYLQKVNVIALDNTQDIVSQRRDSFKLQGYSLANLHLLPLLDPGYEKSDYIKSMMTKKDGNFGMYAKVLTEEDENYLIHLVEGHIKNTYNKIKDADFEIAPKKIDDKDQSCTFCKYKDLCFKKFEDYVNLETKPFPKKEEK